MTLVENIPLNTQAIADLITDPKDLFLVWPDANIPFDHQQWRNALEPSLGNVSFLVYQGGHLVGHAALCRSYQRYVYSVCFLYIAPEYRSRGLGKKLLSILEKYAREELSAKKLLLVARTYNPVALQCYTAGGFTVTYRHETMVLMSKTVSHTSS